MQHSYEGLNSFLIPLYYERAVTYFSLSNPLFISGLSGISGKQGAKSAESPLLFLIGNAKKTILY
jgi:hypothetical protein